MSRDILNEKNNTTRWFLKTDEVVFTGPKDPKKLKPLCLGPDISKQKEQIEKHNYTDKSFWLEWLGNTYGYNAQGYIMPCCWTVQEKGYEEEQFTPLMKDKFHISNVDKIEDVIQSEEWKEFAETLIKRPQNAANICWFFCGRKIDLYSK